MDEERIKCDYSKGFFIIKMGYEIRCVGHCDYKFRISKNDILVGSVACCNCSKNVSYKNRSIHCKSKHWINIK